MHTLQCFGPEGPSSGTHCSVLYSVCLKKVPRDQTLQNDVVVINVSVSQSSVQENVLFGNWINVKAL